MKINIYADGGNKDSIKKYNKGTLIKGFTTNPSILKKQKLKVIKVAGCSKLLKNNLF